MLLRQSHLSHLLITSKTPLSLPARVPYNNNINNYINVIVITYSTHTVSLILSYLSASYVNNSIYFTILTTAIDTITDTNTSTTIVTYYSTTYNNNSIYFTTITLVDITINATYAYSNVLILIY